MVRKKNKLSLSLLPLECAIIGAALALIVTSWLLPASYADQVSLSAAKGLLGLLWLGLCLRRKGRGLTLVFPLFLVVAALLGAIFLFPEMVQLERAGRLEGLQSLRQAAAVTDLLSAVVLGAGLRVGLGVFWRELNL